MTKMTRITYPRQRMGKEYVQVGDCIESHTDGDGSLGWFDVCEVASLAQLDAKLSQFNIHQIMVQGVPDWPCGYVHAGVPAQSMDLSLYPDIQRSKDELHEAVEAVGVIDSDMDAAPAGWWPHLQTPEQHYTFLIAVVPELKGVGLLVRPSGSNGVCYPDGRPFKPSKNYHSFFFCAGDERAAILQRLHGLFAVRGFAWIMLGINGAMHERTPIDRALRTTNQPVFASPPIVFEPLLNRRPASHVVEGKPLRLADLPEVADADVKAAFAALKAVPEKLAEQRIVVAKYIKNRARAGLALTPNPSHQQIRDAVSVEKAFVLSVKEARERGYLLPEHKIETIRHGNVTVREILANPKRWHRVLTKDPLEPEYRGGAQVGILYTDGPVCKLATLAHGGAVYTLRSDEPFDRQVLFGTQLPAETEITALQAKSDLKGHVSHWIMNGGLMGIKGDAGLGKSHEIATALVQLVDDFCLMLSPSTKRSQEAYEDFDKAGGTDGYVYLGRGQPDPKAPDATMCTRPHHAANNLHFGQEGQSLCRGCPLWGKRKCGFDRQRYHIRHTQPRVIFAAHEMAHVPITEWMPTKVIVDETLRNGGVDMSISTPAMNLIGVSRSNPDKDDLCKRLEAHTAAPPADMTFDGMVAHKKYALVLEALIKNPKQVVWTAKAATVGQRLPYIYEGTDTLLIDASLNRKLAELHFGSLRNYVEIDPVKANHHVTQVIGNMMGIKSLLKNKNLLDDVLRVIEPFEAKIVEKQVRQKLGRMDDTSYGHFRALRGMNAWADANSLIVVGYCSPDIPALVAIAEVLTGELVEGKTQRQTRYIRKRHANGKQYPTQVDVHTDEVVQALIESAREEELYQAVYRARQIWHEGEPKRIVLVSPVATRMIVDDVVEWSDFKKGRTEDRLLTAIRREGGEMELGAGALAAKYPDLFGTKETARRDLSEVRQGKRAGLKVLGKGKRGVLKLAYK